MYCCKKELKKIESGKTKPKLTYDEKNMLEKCRKLYIKKKTNNLRLFVRASDQRRVFTLPAAIGNEQFVSMLLYSL